jgi:hypothetical protein
MLAHGRSGENRCRRTSGNFAILRQPGTGAAATVPLGVREKDVQTTACGAEGAAAFYLALPEAPSPSLNFAVPSESEGDKASPSLLRSPTRLKAQSEFQPIER